MGIAVCTVFFVSSSVTFNPVRTRNSVFPMITSPSLFSNSIFCNASAPFTAVLVVPFTLPITLLSSSSLR
uniref:Putative secreted protein n=1 Tax=Ixodes ricinus TaxID=34613 RepID=A0A6B0TX90_IXORI